MAASPQSNVLIKTPRHLPVQKEASTIQLKEGRRETYKSESIQINKHSRYKVKKVELKPFPFFAFRVLLAVDIIDAVSGSFAWLAYPWILSIVLNIITAFFVSAYIKSRIGDYKKQLDKIIKLAKEVMKLSGRSFKTKALRQTAKLVKHLAKGRLSKVAQKKLLRFLIYGLVPFIQIFASWAFFLFMYYKEEKKLVSEINEAAEVVAEAHAQASAEL